MGIVAIVFFRAKAMCDVYVWGSGDIGVPVDREKVCPFPSKVPLPCKVSQVCCADTFTICRSVDGRVYSWGTNGDGRLGHTQGNGSPGMISGLRNVVAIAAGQSHCLAVAKKDDGTAVVMAWGNTFHGALTDSVSASGHLVTPIELPHFKDAREVFAGYANSACITGEGKLFMWGDNRFGKCLGEDDSGKALAEVIPQPTLIPLDAPAVVCALGSLYTAAVDTAGSVYTWGYGRAGNLGHGNRLNVLRPCLVKGIPSRVVHVACTVGQINPPVTGDVAGKENPHTFFVCDDGALYSCGSCHKGMIGNHSKKILAPSDADELVPYHVGSPARDTDVPGKPTEYLKGERCVFAVSASIHSCVITEGGKAFSFGCGSGGRMGIEKYMNGLHGGRSRMKCYVSEPTAIEYFVKNGLHVVNASSSRRHMAALVKS